MSDREYKVWLDSGANIHSCYEQKVKLSELHITAEEFDEMTPEEQDDFMQQIAWSRMDWGYAPVEE